VGSSLYFFYWFVFTAMSDGMTILLLFPNTSRRSIGLALVATLIISATLAGINASGFAVGGRTAIVTRGVSSFLDAAFHASLLLARLWDKPRRVLRWTYVPNSTFTFAWRLLTGVLVVSDLYPRANVGT